MQRSRMLGVGIVLLLFAFVLSACGAAPVPQDWPGLTVDGDLVYVVRDTPRQVYVLDAKAGTQQGQTFGPLSTARGLVYGSPVTLGGGLGFVGFADEQTGTADLYAFDPATQQEKWRAPAKNLILAAPTYAEGGPEHPSGVVYFADSAGFVYAVDAETGALLSGWPFRADEAIWAAPLVAGDRLYVAAMDHNLYALDATTGAEVWSTDVGAAMAASPALDEGQGILYVGAFDGRMYALRADSGEMLSGFDFRAGNWIWSQPLLADDVLYITALDGRLYALDRTTGAVLPPYPYDTAEVANVDDAMRAGPAKAGETVVLVTESGRVIAVSEGRRLWTWPAGDVPQAAISTVPVVAGDVVYVVLMNSQVKALSLENGTVLWTFPLPEPQ